MKSISQKRFAVVMLALAVALALTGSVFSFPALAQDSAEPTPTPSDPIWRAFSAARDAVEEQESIDLTYVRSYTFEQTEWSIGIDSCDSDVLTIDYRPFYYGWTFRITSLRNVTYEVRVSFDLRGVVVCDEVTQGTPVPEGTPDPSLPSPVVGSGATGSFELGGHTLNYATTAITAMRQSGMTWVKKQLRYNLGDSTALAQTFIQGARANGFRILLGVVGNPSQMGDFEGYVRSYSEFLGQVAALGADAIEVWNEPNLAREWPAGQISGANYTRLLAASYNAIKTANANTMVISAAMAPTGFFPATGCVNDGCNDDVFMREMAAAGATNYFDCIGLHYNEGIVSPGTTSGDPRGEYPTYYFGSMLARGLAPFANRPVCFTEVGYLTPEGYGPLPPAFGWAANVTIAQHAAWLADAVSRAAQSGRVRLFIVWNINFARYDDDPMAGYAIIRRDGSCPACTALGQVMRR